MAGPRITLLTDFGTADGYIAAVKGVISSIAPFVIIDDAAHDIPPGDVHAAAWSLGAYWNRYAEGAIHVVVVDPGVGGSRRALAARIDGRFFVAPDNGVLTRVLADAADARVVALGPAAAAGDVVSATFHGRDIFAPAAARLAAGALLDELGQVITDPVLFPLPQPVREPDGALRGEIVHVDRFGNLVTNVPAQLAIECRSASIGVHTMPLLRTYADVEPGETLALIGSRGLVEVSVRDGSAAALLGAGRGSACLLIS